MRLWTLHPVLLDRAGLVAGWREALLAQKVLEGRTRGYRNHPQLDRFRVHDDPLTMIGLFLSELHRESLARGYRFDATKILRPGDASKLSSNKRIQVTKGQVDYELGFLRQKLLGRAPESLDRDCWLSKAVLIQPLFRIVPGDIEPWEKVSA